MMDNEKKKDVLNMADFFNFEEGKEDFPFYNGTPQLSKIDWTVLLLGAFLFIAILETHYIPDEYCPLAYFLTAFLPLAYVSRGKLGYFFKMPKASDTGLILKCFFGYWIYALIALVIISILGAKSASNANLALNLNFLFWINTIIQIMGEELLKVIFLLIFLFLFYHFTQNRKKTIVIAVLMTLIIFGLLHHNAYDNSWAQIILVIGLGSIFYLYAYLKTKNVLISFIIHLMIDWFAFGISAISMSSIIKIPQLINMILSLI